MATINQLTEKGKRVRAHLDRCDYLVGMVTDPEAHDALSKLLEAVEDIVASDEPCWEKGDAADIGFDPDEEPLL